MTLTRPAASQANPQRLGQPGAIATINGQPLPQAGVHAVREAPVLAENLLRCLNNPDNPGKLRAYRGQKRYLSLLTCGEEYAVAQRGDRVLAGKWVWYWKRYIDRRFMAQFPHP